MEVEVNNHSIAISSGSALQQLLEQCAMAEKKGIAVAVNNNVQSRSNWPDYILKPNDKITIIRATQGG